LFASSNCDRLTFKVFRLDVHIDLCDRTENPPIKWTCDPKIEFLAKTNIDVETL
jgi:hypothetical protein